MVNRAKIKSIIECVPPGHRKKFLPLVGYSLCNAVLDLLSIAYLLPFLMLAMSDNPGFENRYLRLIFQKEYLVYSIVLLIVFFIVKNAVSIRVILYQNKTIFGISSEISKHYTTAFIRQQYLFYQKQDKGDIIKNTIEVPNNFASNVLLSLNTIICETFVISIITAAGIWLFPKITLLAVAFFLLSLAMVYMLRKLKLRAVGKSLSADYRNNVNTLLDLINGFFEIKSAAKEQAYLDKFNQSNEKLNKTYAFISAMKNSNAKYVEIIIIALISLLIFYMAHYSQPGAQSILLLSFIASVFFKLVPSVNRLIIAGSGMKSYDYTIDSILKNSVLTDTEKQDDAILLFDTQFAVTNISFRYEAETSLLNAVSFQLKKGKIMGITGRSGTGKTTLLHIILQLIDADSGEISLDGIAITPKNKNAFLKLTSYVTQDPYIFGGTILENIAIGESEANTDLNRIQELVKAIGFEEVINNYPEGIRSATGNNGQKLSGGQKQKLAIIRALYTNPGILILDEATNQLDAENETAILDYIRKLAINEKLTVILISHDPNVLAGCDVVYQFQKGMYHEV